MRSSQLLKTCQEILKVTPWLMGPRAFKRAHVSRWSQWVNHFISHSFLIPSVALPMLGKVLCVQSCHANSLYLVWLLRRTGGFCKSPLALCYTARSAFLIFHDTLAKVTCSGLETQQKHQICLCITIYYCNHRADIYLHEDSMRQSGSIEWQWTQVNPNMLLFKYT